MNLGNGMVPLKADYDDPLQESQHCVVDFKDVDSCDPADSCQAPKPGDYDAVIDLGFSNKRRVRLASLCQCQGRPGAARRQGGRFPGTSRERDPLRIAPGARPTRKRTGGSYRMVPRQQRRAS